MATNATNPLKIRLDGLLAEARTAATYRAREVRSRCCRDATLEQLLQLVYDATEDDDLAFLEEIAVQAREFHEQPPPPREEWQTQEQYDTELEHGPGTHGFCQWLWMLQVGESSLPESIPRELLVAWRDGYANHPCNVLQMRPYDHKLRVSPQPVLRCADCRIVYPARVAVCAVCAGVEFEERNWGYMKDGDPLFRPSRRR